jgi:hypothetical protein
MRYTVVSYLQRLRPLVPYLFVFIFVGTLVCSAFLLHPATVSAQVGNVVGGGGGVVQNPIKYNSIGELIVALVNFLLVLIGALSVLFIIIGAVRMTTSAGNEGAVKQGKSTVTWAVIGLVTALMAFSIISLLQNVIGRK